MKYFVHNQVVNEKRIRMRIYIINDGYNTIDLHTTSICNFNWIIQTYATHNWLWIKLFIQQKIINILGDRNILNKINALEITCKNKNKTFWPGIPNAVLCQKKNQLIFIFHRKLHSFLHFTCFMVVNGSIYITLSCLYYTLNW